MASKKMYSWRETCLVVVIWSLASLVVGIIVGLAVSDILHPDTTLADRACANFYGEDYKSAPVIDMYNATNKRIYCEVLSR